MTDQLEILKTPCPAEQTGAAAINAAKAAWKEVYKTYVDLACLMLGAMSPALQRKFEVIFP